MDNEFTRVINEAEEIQKSGRWDELNKKIVRLASNHNGHEQWQVQVLSSLVAYNFSEYLALKEAYKNAEVEPALLAWRARNLLEIAIWSIYCAQTKENARIFYEDASRDVLGLYKAFTEWGEALSKDKDWLSLFESAKQKLSRRAESEGIVSLEQPYQKVRNVAEKCGIGEHFNLGYKILSKFSHPTSMLIMGISDKQSEKSQRDVFFSSGCVFFVGAFTALEECLDALADQLA